MRTINVILLLLLSTAIALCQTAKPTMVSVPCTPAFKMSQTEVTQAQWNTIMKGFPNKISDKYGLGDNYPIYYVSWYDAIVFCNKLSVKEGKKPCYYLENTNGTKDFASVTKLTDGNAKKEDTHLLQDVKCDMTQNGYRLPTESEWELAAKAGSKFKYAGSNNIEEVAWYVDNANKKNNPVMSKKANAYGLYDMSGSVWEWCQSIYASSGAIRSLRGGSWFNYADYCTVLFKTNYWPDIRGAAVGFRIVCRP